MILFMNCKVYSFRLSVCHTFINELREDLGDEREDLGYQREDLGDQREDLGKKGRPWNKGKTLVRDGGGTAHCLRLIRSMNGGGDNVW